MSSLLDKIKAMVNAGVRGPRRYQREPGRPVETAEPVTPDHQVTQAPRADESLDRTASPVAESPLPLIEQFGREQDQTATLEEERVADLLKGGRTQD
jgi:hypothetical protein